MIGLSAKKQDCHDNKKCLVVALLKGGYRLQLLEGPMQGTKRKYDAKCVKAVERQQEDGPKVLAAVDTAAATPAAPTPTTGADGWMDCFPTIS